MRLKNLIFATTLVLCVAPTMAQNNTPLPAASPPPTLTSFPSDLTVPLSRISPISAYSVPCNATASRAAPTGCTTLPKGFHFWPQTASELATGVTPFNYHYAPGDIRRYGADPTGATDSTVAIQDAIKVAEVSQPGVTGPPSIVFIPAGTFIVSRTLDITSSDVIVRGVGRAESRIRTNTNSMGDVFFVNHGVKWVFDVFFRNLNVIVKPGLSAPANGIDFKSASNFGVEDVAISNATDGIVLNGVDIGNVYNVEVNGNGTSSRTGIHMTANGSIYDSNYFVWIENADIFNVATAGILIGAESIDTQVSASYMEEVPYGVLAENDKTDRDVLVDGLKLNGVSVWNTAPDTFTGTAYFAAVPLSGRSTYLQVRNLDIRGAYSIQGNSSRYHMEFLQNGNTNPATRYSNIQVSGGDWYSASGSLVYCPARDGCTGTFGTGINAVRGRSSGAMVPLQAGSGARMTFVVTWGTGCSMSSGTTCTATVPSGSGHCAAYPQGAIAYYAACSVSGTTATVTANASNSAAWLIQAMQ